MRCKHCGVITRVEKPSSIKAPPSIPKTSVPSRETSSLPLNVQGNSAVAVDRESSKPEKRKPSQAEFDEAALKALDETLKNEQAAKNKQSSQPTEEDAKAQLKAAHDAARALFEKFQNRSMMGVDPSLMRDVIEVPKQARSKTMDDKFTLMELEQIKKELAEAVVTSKNPEVLQLLEHSRKYSPQMVKRLEQQGILTEYAIVTRDRFNQEVLRLSQMAQIAVSEAELELQGILLLDPETEDSTDLEMEQEYI